MKGDLEAASQPRNTSRPRLVRAREMRGLAERLPVGRSERIRLDTRAWIVLSCVAAVVLAAAIALVVTARSGVEDGGEIESVLRDFGYVIREVRGPGLVR